MIPGALFNEPVSSFQWPAPVPTVDPDAGPLFTVCFNQSYLPLILGCLLQLSQEQVWDTTDQTTLNLALNRANSLLALFQIEGCVIPTGMIAPFGATTVPDGWLACDGSAVSRTTYAELFNVIGTTWGAGNGTSTFNVPDMRGRAVVGSGSGSGLSSHAIASTFGEETHTLTTAEVPNHSHTDTGHSHSEGTATSSVINGGLEAPALAAIPSVGITGTGFASLSSSGGGGDHNNIQPSIAAPFIIKT